MNPRVILVPIDFSRLSLQALGPALDLLPPGQGTIHLLHVIDDVQLLASSVDGAISSRLAEGLVNDAKAQFARLVPRLGDRQHRFMIRTGSPSHQILEYADEIRADLIVMATHGREGMARAFLGSTTEHVVRRARCPVLSIRPTDHALKEAGEAAAAGASSKAEQAPA